MTRAALKYDRRPIDPTRVWHGVDAEIPTVGTYRVRMRRDGPPCAVRIWFGAPVDPATGEAMTETRGASFQATLNGAAVELDKVWPGCARDPIDKAEHDRIARLALTTDEDDPFYDPRRRIDPLTSALPF
jgi:hypothetical protein